MRERSNQDLFSSTQASTFATFAVMRRRVLLLRRFPESNTTWNEWLSEGKWTKGQQS